MLPRRSFNKESTLKISTSILDKIGQILKFYEGTEGRLAAETCTSCLPMSW